MQHLMHFFLVTFVLLCVFSLSWVTVYFGVEHSLASVHSTPVEVFFAIAQAVFTTSDIVLRGRIYDVNAHRLVYWEHRRRRELNWMM